jgi:hypothetical protein
MKDDPFSLFVECDDGSRPHCGRPCKKKRCQSDEKHHQAEDQGEYAERPPHSFNIAILYCIEKI